MKPDIKGKKIEAIREQGTEERESNRRVGKIT
jgi:hypothetical protein